MLPRVMLERSYIAIPKTIIDSRPKLQPTTDSKTFHHESNISAPCQKPFEPHCKRKPITRNTVRMHRAKKMHNKIKHKPLTIIAKNRANQIRNVNKDFNSLGSYIPVSFFQYSCGTAVKSEHIHGHEHTTYLRRFFDARCYATTMLR